MKRLIATAFLLATTLLGAVTVEYDLTMSLNVPRIYDNSCSTGYRRYQKQAFKGILKVDVDENCSLNGIFVTDLANRTHKIAGKPVTYDVSVDEDAVWSVIGSNRTDIFKTASVSFSFTADPSYNIGDDSEDNTLILTLSGKGTERTMSGNAAGRIGCGCRAYGHVSPTRRMWTDDVTDVASVHGTWKLKHRRTVK